MKAFKITALFFITLLVMSCNYSESHKHSEVSIELDNGQKWAVNADMKPFILEAENILKQYDNSDYEELAKQLEDKNRGLIKSCTMSGKSHDELHKWLHPHMQLIEKLENAENKEEADKVIADLEKSFRTYHANFQ